MSVSVPLLWPMIALVHRLDTNSTWDIDPPGDLAEGYDPILREPVVYRSAGARVSARQELTVVRVPCQVETARTEDLQMVFTGDDPDSLVVFVLSRPDLRNLNLIDSTTGNVLLKPGDRISALEKYGFPGTIVKQYEKPLYIYQVVSPRSQGFGADGYDLELVYTTHRKTG